MPLPVAETGALKIQDRTGGLGVCPGVLMVLHSSYPDDVRVCKEAQAYQAWGRDVDVICLNRGGEPTRETVDGVRVWRMRIVRRRAGPRRYALEYASFTLWAMAMALFLHLRNRYQVVHVHNIPDLLMLAAVLPKVLGATIVHDMHEPMPEFFSFKYGRPRGSLMIRVLRVIEGLATRVADEVVVVSGAMKSLLLGRGVPKQKVFVMPDLSDAAFDVEDLPQLADEPRLVFHGTMTPLYGLDQLVSALAILRKRLPGVQLDLYGDGTEVSRLLKQAHDLGIRRQVHYHGWIPHACIPSALRRARLGVVPTVASEYSDLSFSGKLAELAAHGVPAVSADLKYLRHYWGDEAFAFTDCTNPEGMADVIERLLVDSSRLEAMRRAAIRRLQQRGWSDAFGEFTARLPPPRTVSVS